MEALSRSAVIPEPGLASGEALLAAGAALARDWRVGPSAFLDHVGQPSEAAYKRARMAEGRIMQHAQVGYRDPEKSRRAYAEIHGACAAAGVIVDRYGICLDWSMGYPRAERAGRPRGTGLILGDADDFAKLTAEAPVAPHFGDFVLGFPAAVENTQAALAAGSTAIGNLGQYFTFRLPHRDDDVAATEATVTALGLIAGQEAEVLVHSNLDDGFAALFTDLACCLGAALIEKHVVEDLIGARVGHCYGHHFSDPLTRLAFQRALAETSDTPGTMVYGDTMSYRGGEGANYASLGHYLLIDVLAQRGRPSGHAVNPVPVSENRRIPDIGEIVEAQLFAARLIARAGDYEPLFEVAEAERAAERIVAGGRAFRDRVLGGLAAAGFDTADAAELLLALRRIGAKRLEELFGPGEADEGAPRGRRPLVPAATFREIERQAAERLSAVPAATRARIGAAGLSALVASTDVHEHGKLLVERMLRDLGVALIDGGVSVDPDDLARLAGSEGADLVAISTYNGVALSFVRALMAELEGLGVTAPVLIGGRLNEIPADSDSSLPLDVRAELRGLGVSPCGDAADLLPVLLDLADRRGRAD